MNVDDYILDCRGIDWPLILRDWAWLIPPRFELWIANRFGDLFVVLDDGSVHMLDVGAGTFEKLAESRDDFATKIDEQDNADVWLLVPAVDRLVAAGKTLGPGECYSSIKPQIMGGDYALENTFVSSIVERFKLYGSIHRRLKDVPEGALVEIVVTD